MKEAVRKALGYLKDNQHLVADNERHAYVMEYNAFIDKLEKMLEQPAQDEPAFYRHEDGHLMTPDRAKFIGLDLNDLQPLYTRPQAREPLTDEQIISVAYDCNAMPEVITDKTLVAFVRALEVIYGIKEGA